MSSMVDSEMPPKSTGRSPMEIDLTDQVFPWEGDCPVYFRMAGSPYLWLPIFSDASKLRGFLQQVEVSHDRVKVIVNHREFFDNYPRKDGELEIRFMIDPYFTEEGKIRYLQVVLK